MCIATLVIYRYLRTLQVQIDLHNWIGNVWRLAILRYQAGSMAFHGKNYVLASALC